MALTSKGSIAMTGRLDGKVALVTGSASGIGQAIAIEFATGGTWFTLTTSGHAGTAQNTAAGLTVTNIEKLMDELRSRGVEFLEYDMGEMGKTNGLLDVGGYKAGWFKDSGGNIVELSQPPTAGGAGTSPG